jgi:hypothetical protein
MHDDTPESKVPGWSWRAGRAARVKLGLPANVAEAVDLRDSAG